MRTNHFAVIGEHGEDSDRLLVLGEDGQPYSWQITTDATEPVEVDADWRLDDELPETASLFSDQLSPESW